MLAAINIVSTPGRARRSSVGLLQGNATVPANHGTTVAKQPHYDFTPGEREVLAELEMTLPRIPAWPQNSPASFVLRLAPRTRGTLGEKLLSGFAGQLGLERRKPSSVDYDIELAGERCEVKFSTEDPPRFQQVRDPRLPQRRLKYDYLVCVAMRPERLVYWMFTAAAVADLMDGGHITVQHAMSETRWFRPSRTDTDAFSRFRCSYAELVDALKAFL